MANSSTPDAEFLCVNALDPIDYPCAKQCDECRATEERERSGVPPEEHPIVKGGIKTQRAIHDR